MNLFLKSKNLDDFLKEFMKKILNLTRTFFKYFKGIKYRENLISLN